MFLFDILLRLLFQRSFSSPRSKFAVKLNETFRRMEHQFIRYFEKSDLLGVKIRIVCSSFKNFVSASAGKENFNGTELLFVQHLSESTVFGVK